ncbi:cell wall-binding repeat-containing protein [Agromyces sp. NPDC055661]
MTLLTRPVRTLAITIATACAITLLVPAPAGADDGLGSQEAPSVQVDAAAAYDVQRVAGDDRFATAAAISRQIIPDGERAPVVYLVNAHNFPDAMAAGPAAIRQGGVILSIPQDWITNPVGLELLRLDPERIVIVGGTAVIDPLVEHILEHSMDLDAKIERIGGADRYETAELIARDAAENGTSGRYAFVATGTNFPDALAAAPAAGKLDAPVLLVPGGPVSAGTRKAIVDLGIDHIVIVGGEASVGRDTADSLAAVPGVVDVSRVAGADRYLTAAQISAQFIGSSENALVATGEGFVDALAGAPLAGALGAPLLLARPGCMPAVTMDRIADSGASSIRLLGGPATLSPAVENLQPLC